jgi:hypothetical protein
VQLSSRKGGDGIPSTHGNGNIGWR